MCLRPFGLYCSACLGILIVSILCMCCSHFSWYCFISFTIFSDPVFSLIQWFFSLSGLKFLFIYLFTYNTFTKLLYMFRALPCSSSGGLRRNCVYAASGIVTVCRWLSCAPVKEEFFSTGAQYSHLQRVTIPEAAYIQLRSRPPEDEQGNAGNM